MGTHLQQIQISKILLKHQTLKLLQTLWFMDRMLDQISICFLKKIEALPLMEGSLYAIEAVTQNIANSIGKETVSSELSTQLTENCQRNLKSILNSPNISESILINNEDIFLSWLGKYDESKMKMKMCTYSFPSYHYLKKKLQEQDKIEKQMAED